MKGRKKGDRREEGKGEDIYRQRERGRERERERE